MYTPCSAHWAIRGLAMDPRATSSCKRPGACSNSSASNSTTACSGSWAGRTYHLPRDFAIPIHRKVLLEAVEGFRAAFAAVADVFILARDAPVRGDVLLDAPPPGSPSGSGSVSCVIIWAMVSMTSFIGGAWVARVWCCASQPCHRARLLQDQAPAHAPHALVDLPEEVRELILGEVALFGVDRFALAAVHGDECHRAEVRLLAQQRALTTDLAAWASDCASGSPPSSCAQAAAASTATSTPHCGGSPVPGDNWTGDGRDSRTCTAAGRDFFGRVVDRSSRGSGCGSLKAACREVEECQQRRRGNGRDSLRQWSRRAALGTQFLRGGSRRG